MAHLHWHKIFEEVEFTAVRSRGPGGQNVNKVSSAAQLTWHYLNSCHLTGEQKQAIRIKLATRINSRNEIYLRSDEYRDYPRNQERCRQKLQEMIAAAVFKPKPRRPTKPTRASKVRKLVAKTRRSDTKKMRQKIRD
jgi:ribosome-associated protein